MLLLSAAVALALAGPPDAQQTAAQSDTQQTGRRTATRQQTAAQPDAQGERRTHKSRRPPPHTGIHALFGTSAKTSSTCRQCRTSTWPRSAAGSALAVHPADQRSTRSVEPLRRREHGICAGQVSRRHARAGGALARDVRDRAIADQPKVAHLGMDLLQAQILSEILVEPLKFAVRRERPDGSNHQSFPSGHAAVTFAAATVIERHLGWRKSVLGYAIASYVAMSRSTTTGTM